MKLLVELKLEVEVPEEYHDCDATLRQWLWNERKDELLQAIRYKEVNRSRQIGGQHDINQKLQLLDTISKVQRQYLHTEKVTTAMC